MQHTGFNYWIHHGSGGVMFGLLIAFLVLVVIPVALIIEGRMKASRAEAARAEARAASRYAG
jgi:hypothetical protein